MENCYLVEELEQTRQLAVSYAKEIDYKNEKLWEMGLKLEEKDRLLREYTEGRGEKQNLIEENEKLKYEMKSRSIKEKDGRAKYELQLRSITTENEKLKYELECKKNELRRANMQRHAHLAEMERIKVKVESGTKEFELRLKELEEHDGIVNKEKLERMEKRANDVEKESMLLKEQLEEKTMRLNEMQKMEGRASKAEKESILLKEQLEEFRRRLNEKIDLERKFSSFRTKNNILVNQLREELINFESELEEARKSKSSLNQNIEFLKEKLLKEKGHVERTESELMKLSEIQLWAKRLEAELSAWMIIKEIPGVSCAADILAKFAALQKEVRESMVKASEANVQMKQMGMQLEELRRRLNEYLHQKNDLQKKLSSCRTENNMLVKQLREELRDYESELHKARNLKTSLENVELQKERLLEEKGHRERAQSELLKLSESQLRAKRLEDELSSSKMIIKAIPGVSCADDLPLKFAALQNELLKSMKKVAEANAHLTQTEEQLEEQTRRLNECLHHKSDLEKNLSPFRTDLVEQLRQELRDYECEPHEAKKLKYCHENIEVMKEKGHRERAESNLLNLSEIQLKAKKLDSELSSWKMVTKEIPGMSSANDKPLSEVEKSTVKAEEATAQWYQVEVALDASILEHYGRNREDGRTVELGGD